LGRTGNLLEGRPTKLCRIFSYEFTKLQALKLLEVSGFDAAEALLGKVDPREQEFYATLEKTNGRLQQLNVKELIELAASPERLNILKDLQRQLQAVVETAEQFQRNAQSASLQRDQHFTVHA
jgi:hypothetical protein